MSQSSPIVRSGLQVQPHRARVGIAGVGAIGQLLATALDRGEVRAELVGVTDLDRALAEKVAGEADAPDAYPVSR